MKTTIIVKKNYIVNLKDLQLKGTMEVSEEILKEVKGHRYFKKWIITIVGKWIDIKKEEKKVETEGDKK